MKPIWKQIIIHTILKPKRIRAGSNKKYSDFELARGMREFKMSVIRHIKDMVLITLGIFSATFGFKGFLLTNHFIDGGATGVSLLISALTGVPLYLLIICINIPFVILGYKTMGQIFAIKTAIAIAGLSICLATITFPDVTR